ncbi:hypothetical protein [Streptomyces sp. CAU 1734]|uniref:hypothetical protein n=1 Tax=Streptomyces sp. CAU 1734 TaxID=3140360 RepID=UPI003261610B
MATSNGILNGQEVIEFEFAETPRSTPESPRHYREVLKVLLADGSVVYNCVWPECAFTRPSANGVWPHTKAHKTPAPAPALVAGEAPDHSMIDVGGLTLAEVIDRAQKSAWYKAERDDALKKLGRISRELDEWKPRARAAEKQLRAIQSAIAGAV